jgi:hypothetical protein
MNDHTYKFSYSKHHSWWAEGHIYIDKPGACTIHLQGAYSMTQEELDALGERIVKLLNKDEERQSKKSKYNLLGG